MNLKFYHLDVRGAGFSINLAAANSPTMETTRVATRRETVMPQQPQEPTPEERRFERIEAAHETLAKAVAAIASDTHTAFAALNTSQQHRMEEMQRIVVQLGKQDTDLHALFKLKTDQDKKLNALTGFMAELALSQTAAEVQIAKMAEAQTRLTESQAKLAAAQQKTEERMANLADTQAKHAEDKDDLKDKLHLLYNVVDNWIREHGSGAKNGGPAPAPPPSA